MNNAKSEDTCRVQHTSRGRIFLRVFLNFFVTSMVLLLILRIFPQLGGVNDLFNTLAVIIILATLQIVIWPITVRGFLILFHKISPAFMLIGFPLISLVLPALFLMIANWLAPGFVINGFGSAFLIAFFMAIISLVFASIFAEDDESGIYQWTLKRLNSKTVSKEDLGKPGIIFLEIDGLGGKALREAMDMGKAPYMKRWLDCGSHRMVIWYSDLSSQSSAAQAGILHGNNFGVPAFRWYDKKSKSLVVSSSLKDVSELEKRLSDGRGLMSNGGVARASLLSGDASRVVMTASRIFDVTSDDLMSYYLNPSNLLKSLSLMMWDWVLEKKAAWGQKIRNEKPRINRGGIYFILRSVMTVLLRDLSFFALKGDMYSGVPYAYATLGGYDEVSHHSGIKRTDTLEVLRKLDRQIGKIERMAMDAPRRYKFVVLSDHGQTQGATFSNRYGEKLETVVHRLINASEKGFNVTGYETQHESAYYIDAAFRNYRFSNSRIGKQIENTLSHNQQVMVGKDGSNDVVVLASGNLGLISFTSIEHRVTLEEIMKEFPGLIPGLVEHPGIGLVMVRSEQKGTVVLGKKGRVYLATGKVEGEDPLSDYGPNTLQNLVREDSFPNTPDILVISTYWKDRDEIAAFEEQVASHGGAGGEQSKPFILYPSEFDLGTDKIIGAETVYKIFKRWTEDVQRA